VDGLGEHWVDPDGGRAARQPGRAEVLKPARPNESRWSLFEFTR